ncbi:MAG: hypothetical protein RLZZ156_503 [Deinococcota bacterium]|jgi:hypothetical protein
MKRLLIGLILVLGACFPTAPVDPGGASLRIESQMTYNSIIFTAGTLEAKDVKLEVYGIPPRVNDAKCREVVAHLECNLGAIPANKRFVLPASGAALTARATFKRDSTSYTLIAP